MTRTLSSNPNYRESRVFASLKDTKESLSGNLTTAQYLRVYDEYLERSLSPIFTNTRVFDAFACQLVNWQITYPRRKSTLGNREDLPRAVTNFLFAVGSEARVKAFRSLKVDRGLLIGFLSKFLESLKDYKKCCEGDNPDLQHNLAVIHKTEAAFRSKKPLYQVLAETEHWFEATCAFKTKIMEKYLRVTLTTAQRDYVKFFDCRVDLDDLIQIYLNYLSRAIDRCDYGQGTLTSHVQTYMVAAKNLAAKEDLRTRLTNSIDHGVDYVDLADQAGFTQNLYLEGRESSEYNSALAELLNIVDPHGIGQYYFKLTDNLQPERNQYVI